MPRSPLVLSGSRLTRSEAAVLSLNGQMANSPTLACACDLDR